MLKHTYLLAISAALVAALPARIASLSHWQRSTPAPQECGNVNDCYRHPQYNVGNPAMPYKGMTCDFGTLGNVGLGQKGTCKVTECIDGWTISTDGVSCDNGGIRHDCQSRQGTAATENGCECPEGFAPDVDDNNVEIPGGGCSLIPTVPGGSGCVSPGARAC